MADERRRRLDFRSTVRESGKMLVVICLSVIFSVITVGYRSYNSCVVVHIYKQLTFLLNSAPVWGIVGSVKLQTTGSNSVRSGNGLPQIALHCLLLMLTAAFLVFL